MRNVKTYAFVLNASGQPDFLEAELTVSQEGYLSKEVTESALAASMFGWGIPAAQAANEYAQKHGGQT